MTVQCEEGINTFLTSLANSSIILHEKGKTAIGSVDEATVIAEVNRLNEELIASKTEVLVLVISALRDALVELIAGIEAVRNGTMTPHDYSLLVEYAKLAVQFYGQCPVLAP